MANINLCPICGMVGEKFCKPCKSVSYCSLNHQRQDWPHHKQNCIPYIVKDCKDDPLLGKMWIASRNLKAGFLLLDESPTFHSPRWTQEEFFPSLSQSQSSSPSSQNCRLQFQQCGGIPNCLTCGLFMQKESDRRCHQCHWPICSVECEKTEIHKDNECRLFKEKKLVFPPPGDIHPAEFCRIIGMIRGMGLKNGNEAAYAEIMKLQHYSTIPEYNDLLIDVCQETGVKLKNLLGNLLEHPLEDYERIWRVEKINAFTGPFFTPMDIREQCAQEIYRKNSRLYPKAARLNHSCAPTCSWTLSPFPRCQIRIRTLIPVKKGQPLSLCYDTGRNLLGTFRRQKLMREESGFVCKCERCLDPTELNTFMSAHTCLSCQQGEAIHVGQEGGTILPDDPLDLTPNAVWTCNRCRRVGKSEDFLPIEEILADQLDARENDGGFSMEPTHLINDGEAFYEKFIEKYQGKLLHKNHWVIQKATTALLKEYHVRQLKDVSQEILQKSIKFIIYILDSMRITSPGLSPDSAKIWRSLAYEIEVLLEKYSSKMSPREIDKNVRLCRRALNTVLDYYKSDDEVEDADVQVKKLEKQIKAFDEKYKAITTTQLPPT